MHTPNAFQGVVIVDWFQCVLEGFRSFPAPRMLEHHRGGPGGAGGAPPRRPGASKSGDIYEYVCNYDVYTSGRANIYICTPGLNCFYSYS